MPGIDVTVRRDIRAPRDLVADFASNPDNAPVWNSNVLSVNWHTDRPAKTGSRFDCVTQILGRRMTYDCEITALSPGITMTLRTRGPMQMDTTYHWADSDAGCAMTVICRARPGGLARIAAPVLARGIRRAATQDLNNLANIAEAMFGPFHT